MKKYIIIALIGGFTIPAFAQEQKRDSLPDMVQLGYQTEMPQKAIAGSTRSVNSKVLDKAPEIDIAKALYGKIAGLNVYQGNGSSAENVPSLSIHGNIPLIWGIERSVFSMVGKNEQKVLKTKGFRHGRENGLNISKRFFSLHGLTSALRLRGFSSDIRGIALHRACRWG